MSMLSKDEAKTIISALDLKPIDTYADCVKRDYNIVMAEEKKPKRNKRIEIKPIDEVMNVESVVINEVLPVVEESHEVVFKQENE
jgi:Asp-tRNA(Asn)/Glu-tRNA(Gln) amidotransferase B subunit